MRAALLLFCLALPGVAQAASPSLEAKLVFPKDHPEGQPLPFGSSFGLQITVRHDPGEVALLPESLALGEAFAERVEARTHRRQSQAQAGGDREIDEYQLELLAFESGKLELPPIPVSIGPSTLKTPALSLQVATGFAGDDLKVLSSTLPAALPELEKLSAQNPPPTEIRRSDHRLIWAAAALLGLGLLAWLLLRLQKRKATQARLEAPKAPEPLPHETALAALSALKAADYIARGEPKPFYGELSMILRRYLGGRYRFDSLDLTLSELGYALDARQTPGLRKAPMLQLLGTADQVKFAKFQPEQSEAEADLALAFALVEESRPQAAPAAEAAAAAAPSDVEEPKA